MTDDEILSVVQAHKEGKKIEVRPNDGFSTWENCVVKEPKWNFEKCDYRVAPEPRKPREWWICDGTDHKYWIVVDDKHTDCRGERVRVREVIEDPFDLDKIPSKIYCK